MQKEWRIQELLDWTRERFERLNIEEPRLEAEVLLGHALKIDRISLYVNYDRPVNEEERAGFREMVQRRIKGEPAAYIVGEKEFMSLPFTVDARVLIPRPDTEVLVEECLKVAAGMEKIPSIADVGTGSGAIAVSVARYLPEARVIALDIDEGALEVARVNINLNRVENQIQLVKGNLLQGMPKARFDIILANLPYIPSEKMDSLPYGVREFEPRQALDGGPGGVMFYLELMESARDQLAANGYLLMEIGDAEQAQLLLAAEHPWWQEHYMVKDLGNRDRVLVLKKGEHEDADHVSQS